MQWIRTTLLKFINAKTVFFIFCATIRNFVQIKFVRIEKYCIINQTADKVGYGEIPIWRVKIKNREMLVTNKMLQQIKNSAISRTIVITQWVLWEKIQDF